MVITPANDEKDIVKIEKKFVKNMQQTNEKRKLVIQEQIDLQKKKQEEI